jgi:ATP-dependent exoDNAse (exonuclease V) beta subunit
LAQILGQTHDSSLESEFILVQGVTDLAVLSPNEIWLVDFKTDQVHSDDLAARVKVYESQLNLYGRALSQIYQRPVTESWFYFLVLKRAVAVAAKGTD